MKTIFAGSLLCGSKSKALGEKKKVKFDINKIVNDDIEELEIKETSSGLNQHGTEINLYQLEDVLGNY